MKISSCIKAWGSFSRRARLSGVPQITNNGRPMASALPYRWWEEVLEVAPSLTIPSEEVSSLDTRVHFSAVCSEVATQKKAYVVTSEHIPKFVLVPVDWTRQVVERKLLPGKGNQYMEIEHEQE